MLAQLFPNPEIQEKLTASSSGALIQTYANSLQAEGYCVSTMQHWIRAAAHFTNWIDTQNVTLQDADELVLERFRNHLPVCVWLPQPKQTDLRRAFKEWFGRVPLPRRLSGTEIEAVHDLTKVQAMLAERVKTCTKPW